MVRDRSRVWFEWSENVVSIHFGHTDPICTNTVCYSPSSVAYLLLFFFSFLLLVLGQDSFFSEMANPIWFKFRSRRNSKN